MFRLTETQVQPPLLRRFPGTLLRSSCALYLSLMATSSTSTSSEHTVGRAQVGISHQHCLFMSVAVHAEAWSILDMHWCFLAILALLAHQKVHYMPDLAWRLHNQGII